MTQNSRLGHLLSIFSLIAILLVAQTSGYNYVWCFGTDGHTAVEQAHSSCCEHDTEHHAEVSSHHEHSEISNDHCGPCLDLLPSSHYASNRLRDDLLSFHSLTIAPPVVEPFLRVASLPLQPQIVIADVAPRIRDQIVHHRTIVMLN